MRNKIALIVLFLMASMIIGGCGIRNIEREKFVVLMGTDGQYRAYRIEKAKYWSGYLMSIVDATSIYGRADSNELEIGIGKITYKTDPNSIGATGTVFIRGGNL